MDTKTLTVLEFPKILKQLTKFCDFSASAELARSLTPTPDYDIALTRLAETSEARQLLSLSDVTIGGSHDIREQVDLAARGGVLEPRDLLDVQSTLIAMRDLRRYFEKHTETYPRLTEIALRLPAPSGVVEAISRCIAENAEVLDSASPKLADLRREVRLAHDRLMARLQKYLTDPATTPMLQETLITSRDGRYVLPLRAEFKGQIKSIVHDQSSTGATLFIEPLAVVELNNAYRELQLAERDEIRRLLTELSTQVGALAGEITPGVAALAEMDLVFSKAKYADDLHAVEPILHPSKDRKTKTTASAPPPTFKLLAARHPLLEPSSVVPVTIDPAPGTFAIVITGPNTGGKTVTLKIVGLLAAMAQSGLHIPVQSGSELPCFGALFADIGDEQSIEQSLSTFSGHITNIVQILKKANHHSLVILDELGAGTDPQEGSALARAILLHLLEAGITTFVATHYPELKTFAHSMPGVVNASLEFDVRTLRPTYKLTIGLPGRSNALAIAERLGLPSEIIGAARAEINPDDLRADKLIGDIHRQRKIAFQESEKAERARSEARHLERELTERLDKIEEERAFILQNARMEAKSQIQALRVEIQELRRRLQKTHQPLDSIKPILEKTERLHKEIRKIDTQHPTFQHKGLPAFMDRSFQIGETVIVPKLGMEGVIAAMDDEQAEVQAGAVRMRVKLDNLERKASQVDKTKEKQITGKQIRSSTQSSFLRPSPGIEIHLRGKRVDDALSELEQYLEQAYLAGLPFIRIIHGKGTGTLRQVVHEALTRHPYIASFKEGGENEGGSGVTVAKLIYD